MKPKITWIVAADGNQARFFENDGVGKGLTQLPDMTLTQKPKQAGDIMADKPGRAFASAGHGRSAMEPSTDPVAKREDDFARQLAALLEHKAAQSAFDRLVLAAAPKALGDLRQHLGAGTKKMLIAELPKDLTNIPTPEIGKHLDGIIAT